MSQDSREKFGMESQISIGGGGWGRKKKDMLRAGQRRSSIVCVNGVKHYKS